jgi:hypothetical protein
LFWLGLFFAAVGTLTLLTRRRAAEKGLEEHRLLARIFPWLYRIPPAPLALNRDFMEVFVLAGGILFVILGVILMIVSFFV